MECIQFLVNTFICELTHEMIKKISTFSMTGNEGAELAYHVIGSDYS